MRLLFFRIKSQPGVPYKNIAHKKKEMFFEAFET